MAASFVALAAAESAPELFKQGEQAEKAHQMARAFLLYSQAAALEPSSAKYWLKAQSVRVQAVLQSPPKSQDGASLLPTTLMESAISDRELAEARKPQAPVEVAGKPGRQTLELLGDGKALYARVAKAYGLDVVFDGEYQTGRSFKLRIVDADFRDALRELAAATGSFAVPISNKVLLVAKDTEQKRRDIEPTMAVVVSIPDPVALQEAQELAQAVRQVMEINKFQFDASRRLALFRDRVSKVRPAQLLYEQLLHPRVDVELELEFIEIGANSSNTFGVKLPTTIPLVALGKITNYTPSIPSGFSTFYTFGGGKSLMGIGAVSASLAANMSGGNALTLLKADLRASDGQAATFHVGDRYPIMTSSFSGGTASTTSASGAFALAPSFSFEDLGLLLKITPRVHSSDEVSLEIEAEFKVLGSSSVDGIPIISNRKIQSRIRLKADEWGVVAGMLTTSDIRSLSGLGGLSQLPILGPLTRSGTTTRDSSSVFILLKPRILGLPASEFANRPIWTGSEGRPLFPM